MKLAVLTLFKREPKQSVSDNLLLSEESKRVRSSNPVISTLLELEIG